MKKWIQMTDLPLIVGATGFLGAAVRLWQILRGVDQKGLLIPGHPAGMLQLVLLALTALFLACFTRSAGTETKYSRNFPASPLGALGTLLGAVGILAAAVQQLTAGKAFLLDAISGVAGILAGPALLLAAKGRLRGEKVPCLFHIPTCLFLALWLFTKCHVWGAEPEIGRFFPDLAAVLALMIASYHLTTFDVNLGSRRAYLFWALLASYACMAAVPGSSNKILLVCGAAWMLTNLCALQSPAGEASPAPQEAAPAPQPEPETKARQAEDIVPPMPEFEEEAPAAPSPDAELEQWLRLIDELEHEDP